MGEGGPREVEGTVWVADESRQAGYGFVVSVPQKLLDRRENFRIEEVVLDWERKLLRVVVVSLNERGSK